MIATSEGPHDRVHRVRERTRWTWFPLLLVTSLTACGPTDQATDREVIEPGAHPFDLLPEAQLEELGSLGRDGLPFTVGSNRALAPVSDTSFVALVREPGAEASGIAHATLSGTILSWTASPAELEGWSRGRRPRFGLSGDSVWIFASDGSNYVLIVRSLDGDDLGRRVAPADVSPAVQQGANELVSGLLAGGSGFVDTSPALPPLPRRVFPLPAVLIESDEGSVGDTVFRGGETRPGPAGGFFTRAGLLGVPYEPFGHPPLHHLASTGDRLVVVNWDEDDPGDLEIRVWSFPSGETRDVRVPLPRLRMTEDQRARALDEGVRLLDEMERRRERTSPTLPPWRTGPEALQDYVHFPPFMPSVRAVHSGEDGTIWLLRDELSPLYLGREPQERGMITWVALNPEGVPLFRVSVPERSRLVMASRSEIWTVSMEDGRLIRWGVVVPRPDHDRGMGRVHPGRPDEPPTKDEVRALFEAAFSAGLEREEGQPLTFTLTLYPREKAEHANPKLLLPFYDSLSLTVQGISRLALERFDEIPVVTEEFPSSYRPDTFSVTAVGPGSLSISRGGSRIASFESGEIVRSIPQPFDSEAMGNYISDLISDNPGVERFGKEYWLHFREALERVLAQVSVRGHGGTVIIVAASALDESNELYETGYSLRESLQLDDMLCSMLELSRDQTLMRLELKKKITDRLAALAQLACVDGALMLTTRLEVLCFGARLKADGWDLGLTIGPDGYGGGCAASSRRRRPTSP